MNVAVTDNNERALALMESVLRGGAGLAPEYPLVFDSEMPGRIVACEEDGEVRSACAILPRELITPRASLRVGMIGSVSTHPDHRGKGFATRVLEQAEDELREAGCMFSLLWADEPDFYTKRGYIEVGAEHDFVLDAAQISKLPASDEVRPIEQKDTQQVHSLYLRHPERVERTERETAALVMSPGMEVLVKENAGQVVAYSCLGRGGDMRNVIHEWGGRPEDFTACAHAHLRRRAMQGDTSEVFIIAPTSSAPLKKHLTKVGARCSVGVLGMGKLLNLDRLKDLFAWFVGPDGNVRVDQRPAQLKANGQPGLRVQGPNMALLFEAEEAFRILLSARGERTDAKYLERALGVKLADLPLSPFVWGLDSI